MQNNAQRFDRRNQSQNSQQQQQQQMINLHMHVRACVCVYVCMSFPFPGLKMAGGNKSDNGQPRRHCSCQLPENGKYYASVLLRQAHALALALTLARTSQPGHCSAVLPASGSSSLTPTHTCAGVCAFVLKVSVCLAA